MTGGEIMFDLENFLSTVDSLLDTRIGRHIIGGVLVSFSMLFGGLAITALTVRPEDERKDKNRYE